MDGKTGEQEREKKPRLVPLKSKLLADLIKRVNWLDFDKELPSLSVKSVDAHDWQDHYESRSLFEKPFEKWVDEARNQLYVATKDLPEELQRHIWGTDLSNITVWIFRGDPELDIIEVWNQTKEAVECYENYQLLRHQFFLISTIAEMYSSNNVFREPYSMPFSKMPTLKLYKNGTKEEIKDDFSQVLDDPKFDYRRIRCCKHKKCRKYFWAGKTNQKCCSSKCNNRVNALDSMKKLKAKREADPVGFNEKRRADTERREKNKIRKISKLQK